MGYEDLGPAFALLALSMSGGMGGAYKLKNPSDPNDKRTEDDIERLPYTNLTNKEARVKSRKDLRNTFLITLIPAIIILIICLISTNGTMIIENIAGLVVVSIIAAIFTFIWGGMLYKYIWYYPRLFPDNDDTVIVKQ